MQTGYHSLLILDIRHLTGQAKHMMTLLADHRCYIWCKDGAWSTTSSTQSTSIAAVRVDSQRLFIDHPCIQRTSIDTIMTGSLRQLGVHAAFGDHCWYDLGVDLRLNGLIKHSTHPASGAQSIKRLTMMGHLRPEQRLRVHQLRRCCSVATVLRSLPATAAADPG